MEGKTDMSEEYEKFHEIPPFNVKADPSILINDEDYPWLRRNKQTTQAKKKWRLSPATIMMITCQLCNRRVWYHCPFCTRRSSSFCRNPLNFLAHAMWMKWWYHANFQPFQSSILGSYSSKLLVNAWKITNEVRKDWKMMMWLWMVHFEHTKSQEFK